MFSTQKCFLDASKSLLETTQHVENSQFFLINRVIPPIDQKPRFTQVQNLFFWEFSEDLFFFLEAFLWSPFASFQRNRSRFLSSRQQNSKAKIKKKFGPSSWSKICHGLATNVISVVIWPKYVFHKSEFSVCFSDLTSLGEDEEISFCFFLVQPTILFFFGEVWPKLVQPTILFFLQSENDLFFLFLEHSSCRREGRILHCWEIAGITWALQTFHPQSMLPFVFLLSSWCFEVMPFICVNTVYSLVHPRDRLTLLFVSWRNSSKPICQ